MATTPWRAAVHTYDPDASGRCQSGWYNDGGVWVACTSTQRSSVLHDDPEAAFREMHDHGGGDCMCYEDAPGGYYGAMRAYVEMMRPPRKGAMRPTCNQCWWNLAEPGLSVCRECADRTPCDDCGRSDGWHDPEVEH